MWISTIGIDFVTGKGKKLPIAMTTNEKLVTELLESPTLPTWVENAKGLERLRLAVAHLIEMDFAGLCQLLYRVDVDETLLKEQLATSSRPPEEIIANLLLERQKQKVALRAKYTIRPSDIPEEDRW